jgi:hypothetical protein
MQRAITTLTLATILLSATISLVLGWRLQSGECVHVYLPFNSHIAIGDACSAIEPQNRKTSQSTTPQSTTPQSSP